MTKLGLFLIFTLIISLVIAEELEMDKRYINAKDINESPRMQEILRKFRSETNEFSENESENTPFIVGGNNATRGQIPHQILMYIVHPGDLVYLCGGTVIDQNWILTAAHCVDGDFEYLNLYYGVVNINGPATWSAKVYMSDVIIHEEYVAEFLRNDIALIKVTNAPSNLLQNTYVDRVDMPKNYMSSSFVGYTSRVSGFGRYSDSSTNTSPVLKYVDLPIISNTECSSRFLPELVRDTNICQGTRFDASGCKGDSGGPLTTSFNGITILIGVVSFGASTGCQLGFPSGFTRVTSFLNWIEAKTNLIFVAPTTLPPTQSTEAPTTPGGAIINSMNFVLLIIAQAMLIFMKF